jgi:uncharacterized RDD family membrane protein YckC
MASFIDFLILAVIFFIELAICHKFFDFKKLFNYQVSMLIPKVMALITEIVYFSYCESSKKQATIGKKAMGIIVTDLNGERLTVFKAVSRVVIKNIGSIIWIFSNISNLSIIGLFECLVALFTTKKQAVHDLIVGSFVIDKEITN